MKSFAAVVLLCLLAPATLARPETPPVAGAWSTFAPKPGVKAALLGARSLTVHHERRIAPGETLTLDGQRLAWGKDRSERVVITVTPPGEEARAKKTTLKSLPALLTVSAFDQSYGLSVRMVGDSLFVGSAFGLPLGKGAGRAYVVDSDLDGKHGTDGDGVVVAETRTVAPWSGQAWTRQGGILVRRRDDGRWEQAAIALPHPGNADHSKAWCLVQWRRQQAGLLPLFYKASLEPGLKAHANYCRENGTWGHEEDERRRGYTREGAEAGIQSVLGYGVSSALAGLEMQLATLYHRHGPLSPALTHSAIVFELGLFGMNVKDSARGPLRHHPLVYPAHGMEKVRATFHSAGEIPMPVANVEADQNRLGTPVSLYCPVLLEHEALASPPKISVVSINGRGRAGQEVRGSLHYPGHPPKPVTNRSNHGEIGLVPAAPLWRGRKYRCRLRLELPAVVTVARPWRGKAFDYKWEFTAE